MAGETPEIDMGAVVIDGQRYEPTDVRNQTLGHRLHLSEELAASSMRDPGEYAAIDGTVRRGLTILGDAYRSGHAFSLLAALFQRVGEPWTLDQAKLNATVFESARGDAAEALAAHLSTTLVTVFGKGSSSARISPISIESTTGPAPSAPASQAPHGTISESSTESSDRSQVTTRGDTQKSSTGRSGRRSSHSAGSFRTTPSANTGTTS